MERKIITVKPGGEMQFIHDDRLRELLKQGEATIKRASNVEPGDADKGHSPLRWYADMSPSGSQDILGPFDTRAEALAAEVIWIETHVLTTEYA